MNKSIKILSDVGRSDTGTTHRRKNNLQCRKLLIRKGRWERIQVLEALLLFCIVSDHVFVEGLAKTKLLHGDKLRSLFSLISVIPQFPPIPLCTVD